VPIRLVHSGWQQSSLQGSRVRRRQGNVCERRGLSDVDPAPRLELQYLQEGRGRHALRDAAGHLLEGQLGLQGRGNMNTHASLTTCKPSNTIRWYHCMPTCVLNSDFRMSMNSSVRVWWEAEPRLPLPLPLLLSPACSAALRVKALVTSCVTASTAQTVSYVGNAHTTGVRSALVYLGDGVGSGEGRLPCSGRAAAASLALLHRRRVPEGQRRIKSRHVVVVAAEAAEVVSTQAVALPCPVYTTQSRGGVSNSKQRQR
jgi:hypothetical protein